MSNLYIVVSLWYLALVGLHFLAISFPIVAGIILFICFLISCNGLITIVKIKGKIL